MAKSDRRTTKSARFETRGGYRSSDRLAAQLPPPPRGVAPGARPAETTKSGKKAG